MQNERGFTLIELLAVMTAIAIMATLLLPALENLTNEARILVVESDIQQVVAALNRFHADTGVWPADVEPDPAAGAADPDLMGGECAEGGLAAAFVGLPEVPGTTARTSGPAAGRDTGSMGLLCKGSLPSLPPVALSRVREFLAEGAIDLLCAGALSPAEASRLRRQFREDEVALLCRGELPPARWDLLREALAEGARDLLCAGALSPAHASRLRRRLSDVDLDLVCKGVLPPVVGARIRALIAFPADVSTPAPAANAHMMRWNGPYLRKEVKANPFGGSYILDNHQNLIDVVDAPLRIPDVAIRVTQLPRSVQERIDADLDDGNLSTGWIRRDLLTPTTLVVIVAAY